MMQRRKENLLIIGSGPAAWTAAVYAARANLHPVVYEGEPVGTMLPGGQLMNTTEVENYPGFPEGITGSALMERMRQQALHHGARAISEPIESIELSGHPFRAKPKYSEAFTALAVIVATGANARWLEVPNEERLAQTGGGVSACAVCDGALPFYRSKVLGVVGGGDSAMEEALYLTKYAAAVHIIHRRDSFRASKVMVDRVLSNPKVRPLWNKKVVEVLGYDAISGVRLEDTITGERSLLDLGGLFVAIGHTPNTAFLNGQLELTPSGYIKVQGGRTATNVPGVYAAGDVMDDYYRQAITAAGTGCMAALEAERWLAHQGLGVSPLLETAETRASARGVAPAPSTT